MATCSASAAAPFESVAEILRKLQSVGFCSDLDVSNMEPPGGENLRCLFDQILSAFFKEICKIGEIRPLPAMLGDARSLDLFKLYSVVQAKGGYDAVTGKCAWQSVAEAIGLDSGLGSSLKLVFFKYLDALDLWLQRVSGKKTVPDRTGYKNPSSLMVSRRTKDHEKDCKSTLPPSTNKDQFLTPFGGDRGKLQVIDVRSDNDDAIILENCIVNGGYNHHKRKRGALVGMLDWVRKVAKSPVDPSVADLLLSDKGKGKAHAVGELYARALLARQAMYFRRTRRTSPNVTHVQEGQKIHTSICENGIGSTNQAKAIKSNQELQSAGWLSMDQQRAKIPVGAHFQAKVPIWTGHPTIFPTDSDTLKWLGTQIWPPENQESGTLLDRAPIGRGRQDTCQCELPGSVECIRFHVAEKRLQLKRELGPAFHAWRFERMGEEVALSWTEEEEKKFKDIVFRNRPSLNKNFWDQLYSYFPFKGRKILVSYYFNVFLLGRRRYQNRVMPKNIDSDDDETEFVFLSNSFGHNVFKICDSKSIVCTPNWQCVDIDA